MNAIEVALAFLLSFFGLMEEGASDPLPPRPVLWTTAIPQSPKDIRLVGTVEPKVRTNHAFRALGQLITRSVSVGDTVTKGQLVASIDPTTFELDVRSAQAAVSIAKATLTSAILEENRQLALLSSSTTTVAAHDVVKQKLDAAQADLTRANATLAKVEELSSFTRLIAEHDGAVVKVFAEVGEIVSPGSTILTIASTNIREAIIDLPDTIGGTLSLETNAVISLELDPSIQTTGRISEIAPTADSLSRTVRVRVTLDKAPKAFRLGATIIVNFVSNDPSAMMLPKTAILYEGNQTFTWAINDQTNSVSKLWVTIGEVRGNLVEIVDGLKTGTRVVIAGVNSLEDGQPIRLGEELKN